MANATVKASGNGFNAVTLIDCRIAGAPSYYPAHLKDGKTVQAQTEFTVYQNVRNRKMAFKVNAWGKMADVIARGGAPGKQVHLVCNIHSYKGRVWVEDQASGQFTFLTKPDGQPILTDKVGLTVENLTFGVDSAKTIQEEIQTGFRPVGWNDPASPGYLEWRNRCAQNNAVQFVPGMETFGYAKVRKVNGQVIAPNAQPQPQPQSNPQFINGQYVGQQVPPQMQPQYQAPANTYNQPAQQAPAAYANANTGYANVTM